MTRSPPRHSRPSRACATISPPSAPKPPPDPAAGEHPAAGIPDAALRGGELRILTIDRGDGRGTAVAHVRLPATGTAVRAGLLILPPLGEEGGRARRFLSHFARLLAGCGIASLVLDLSGTGESPQARPPSCLDRWFDEIDIACDRLTEIASLARTSALFGMRHGGMVAAAHCRSRTGREQEGPRQLILLDAPPEPAGGRLARVGRRLFPDMRAADADMPAALHDPELARFVRDVPGRILPASLPQAGKTRKAKKAAPAAGNLHRFVTAGATPPVWAQREALVPPDLLTELARQVAGILVPGVADASTRSAPT